MSPVTNALRLLKVATFASVCVLFAAGRSFAQSGCPETSSPSAARLAAEARVARPQVARGGNTLYMMQARKKPSGLAKAEVQVVCVPDFTGMTLDQAKAAIEKTKGLHFDNALPADGGTVMDQNPKPFHYFPIGTGVTLQLQPPEPVSHLRQVPDITHLDESKVEGFLKHAGLAYGGSSNTETNDYPVGTIFQDPPERQWVEENTPVFRHQAAAPPQQSTKYQLSLRASATELSINERVSFEALLTPPVAGAGYAFDFGDGPGGDLDGSKTAANQYTRDGTFTITVTAVLPSGESLQAQTTVQVHANSWTIVLQPNLRRAKTNTPILFEATLLPSSPAPEQARYWFYFDNDEKPVISNLPSARRSFSDARTHWASVVVKDTDGHSFRSNVAAVVIVRPLWPSVVGAFAAIAILALGVLTIAQKIATGRLKYDWVADVRGTQLVTTVPGGVVDAGFEFRVVHSPLDVSTHCAGRIIKRVERSV